MQKELEHRSNGITRRIEHYKYECGNYPTTIEDITRFEHQEQIKQEQDKKMSKQAKTQQPTVDYKKINKTHHTNNTKYRDHEK